MGYFVSYKRQCITKERAHISPLIAFPSAIEALFYALQAPDCFPTPDIAY